MQKNIKLTCIVTDNNQFFAEPMLKHATQKCPFRRYAHMSFIGDV
jgi:hypothetical protein